MIYYTKTKKIKSVYILQNSKSIFLNKLLLYMKNKTYYSLLTILFLSISYFGFAQDGKKSAGSGNYAGVGHLNVGFQTYWNYSSSLGFQADYEFNLANDFTVGPSVSYSGWDNAGYKYSVWGVGARFRWYADRVLQITHPKWDVFANGDIGFNIYNYPDYDQHKSYSPLWIGLGIGGKFHFNEKIGLQLIIGSGAQLGLHIGL